MYILAQIPSSTTWAEVGTFLGCVVAVIAVIVLILTGINQYRKLVTPAPRTPKSEEFVTWGELKEEVLSLRTESREAHLHLRTEFENLRKDHADEYVSLSKRLDEQITYDRKRTQDLAGAIHSNSLSVESMIGILEQMHKFKVPRSPIRAPEDENTK